MHHPLLLVFLPRLVHLKVSGATPTLKEAVSNSVTVKQVPIFQLIFSFFLALLYCLSALTVDSDTVTEMTVSQNVSSVRDGNGPTISARFSIVLLLNGRDISYNFNKTGKHFDLFDIQVKEKEEVREQICHRY
jgi:hypothetical protein